MSNSKMTNSTRWRNFRNKIDSERISQKSVNQNLLEYIGILSMQIEQLTKVVNEQQIAISQINQAGANLTAGTQKGFDEISQFINGQLIPFINECVATKKDDPVAEQMEEIPPVKKDYNLTRADLKKYLYNEAFDEPEKKEEEGGD